MDLDTLLHNATQLKETTVAIASAEDFEVLEAVAMAIEKKIARFILFGQSDKMKLILNNHFSKLLESDQIEIRNTHSVEESAKKAVLSVRDREASVLMKGNLATSVLLKAVLNKEHGLRTGKMLSHVAAFDIPSLKRLLLVTDAGMNIEPDLEQKVEIVKNAVEIAQSIGINLPKVAPLAAVEVINPAMQATIDAAVLTQMNRRGQITNCIIDGPLALDNAVSLQAAEHKGIQSDVAGEADILLVPNIETGNSLYKSLIYFANAKVGAVIAGAKAPIVLTSRADSAESKLNSLSLAICSANYEEK